MIEINIFAVKLYNIMAKTSIILWLTLGIQFLSFGQQSNSQNARHFLGNPAYFEQIEILYDIAEVQDMSKLRNTPIYSKARGATFLSAINYVNNRALRKLKIEAKMLGADAVHIVENYQKGHTLYASVYATYTAVPYLNDAITLAQVQSTTANKNYSIITSARYNRNAANVNTTFRNEKQQHKLNKAFEENGQLYVLLTINNKTEKCQIVKIQDDRVILAQSQSR